MSTDVMAWLLLAAVTGASSFVGTLAAIWVGLRFWGKQAVKS